MAINSNAGLRFPASSQVGQGGSGATTLSYTAPGAGAVARTASAKFDDSPSVKDYGAKGDGTTDDTGAFTAAMSALKPNVGFAPQSQSRRLLVPSGTYKITAPIAVYAGIHILGEGSASNLLGVGITSGRGIIEPSATDLTNYCYNLIVEDMGFTSTATGVWAIKQNIGNTLNCKFRNLFINTLYGIGLDSYAQDVEIDAIFCISAIERFLYLLGNENRVGLIEVNNATGTSTEAYVEVRGNGNSFGKVIYDGTGSANKAMFRAVGCDRLRIDDFWMERAGSRVGLSVDSSTVSVGQISSGFNSYGIELANGSFVHFDELKASDTDIGFTALPITLSDTVSTLDIGTLQTRRFDSYNPRPQIRVHHQITLGLLSPVIAGNLATFVVNPPLGGNLLVGGGFDKAAGWTVPANTFSTAEYIASDRGPGKMFHGIMGSTATGSQNFNQDITITAAMVGERIELSGWIKCTGISLATAAVNGCGITQTLNFARAFPGDGWCRIRASYVPTSAGALNVRIWCLGSAPGGVVWLDDFCVWCDGSSGQTDASIMAPSPTTGIYPDPTTVAVYHLDARSTGLARDGFARIIGKLFGGVATDPYNFTLRIHTNPFPEVASAGWTFGKLTLRSATRHSNSGTYEEQESTWPFTIKNVSTSSVIIQTAAETTVKDATITNNDVTFALTSSSIQGATQLGSGNLDYTADLIFSLNSVGRTAPLHSCIVDCSLWWD